MTVWTGWIIRETFLLQDKLLANLISLVVAELLQNTPFRKRILERSIDIDGPTGCP